MIKTVLSSLLAKGISVESELREKLESEIRGRIEDAQTTLKAELESRGIKLTVPDLLSLIEEMSPPTANAALSYALDAMKSFVSGMGLRVARLTDHQIEVVIPLKARNLNEAQELHEAVLVGAGIEALKLLWERHSPLDTKIKIQIQKIETRLIEMSHRECRVRYELPEHTREKILSELRSQRASQVDAPILVFDDSEKRVAEMTIHLQITGVTLVG